MTRDMNLKRSEAQIWDKNSQTLNKLDAAWLAALVGGEGYLPYQRKSRVTTPARTYAYYYWPLQLGIEMGEEGWAGRAAERCGISYRKEPDGKWKMVASGSRAFEIVKTIRPYLLGLRAEAADMVSRLDPNLPGSLERPSLPTLRKFKSSAVFFEAVPPR